ncbi:MAG TPA: hypothetical protein VMN99_15605 [Anaerolineales bacterium]|nr:hypothetical protein [Anaerolineales bacterium]
MAVKLDSKHVPDFTLRVGSELGDFVLQFRLMEGTPLYKRPWFYIAGWLAFLLVIYFWQIFRMGGLQVNQVRIFFDLFCIFPILLGLWMIFFAQFVLPVHTTSDRWKIVGRLVARLIGSKGPAIFIHNGIQKLGEGEEKRRGAGVLWLDTASAAVTRTAVKFKQVLGPGVHFIDSGEYIAGTIDLHNQTQSLGPREVDKPFDGKTDNQTEEEYFQIQDRRKQVSALTRDGIEIVPNISIMFRVNTGFPGEGQPGSRFGYRTGTAPIDKKNEEEDKQAIRKAILGEGINPNFKPESPRHRMAWNQLPALLAADLWREYAAKFTADQLFDAKQEVPPPPPAPPQLTEEEIDELSRPVQLGEGGDIMQFTTARVLRRVNLWMAGATIRLEGKNGTKNQGRSNGSKSESADGQDKPQMKTAFQVINEMVTARLKQPFVDYLDDTGKRDTGHDPIPSPEYELLRKRGLIVLSAGVSNPRFSPVIEEKVIGQWEANWLGNARKERDQIDRRRSLVETAGLEDALLQYAESMSRALVRENPQDLKAAFKTLLNRTRSLIIRSDQLRRKMSTEQEELDNIIRWIEVNGS